MKKVVRYSIIKIGKNTNDMRLHVKQYFTMSLDEEISQNPLKTHFVIYSLGKTNVCRRK